MENDYNVCADRDNSIIFKIKKLSKFQTYYFGFLLIILLLPFAGFLVLFIKFELLKNIVYCSNQQSTAPEQHAALPSLRAERVGSSSGLAIEGGAKAQEEDVLNQQSNTNEQSVIIRGNPYPFDGNSTEVGGETLGSGSNSSRILEGVGDKVKINSNVQSNVNKQLQPPLSNNEINFKNKQQNINIQVYNGHKQLEKHYTYTSPPQYNARSFNSQNTGS